MAKVARRRSGRFFNSGSLDMKSESSPHFKNFAALMSDIRIRDFQVDRETMQYPSPHRNSTSFDLVKSSHRYDIPYRPTLMLVHVKLELFFKLFVLYFLKYLCQLCR